MAIRKFRKIMKPFTILISIVFVLSLVYGGYESFKSSRANQKAQEALSLNGKKITKVEIERTKNELANQYSSMNGAQVDKSLIDIVAFNQVIDKFLTLDIAKKLKVKVPSSEVEEQFKQIEDSIGDKDQFRRMLEFQGLTKDSYKAKIEENLLLTKTIEAFSNEIKPTEEEIKKYYDLTINNRNVEYDSVKEQIIKEIKSTEGLKKYAEALNLAKKEAKIKDIATEYQTLLETTAYEEESFVITNLDLAMQTITEILQKKASTKEEAEKLAKEDISKMIKIAKISKDKGVVVPENLSMLAKFDEYQRGLIFKLRDEVKFTDEELKNFFNTYKSRYEIKASAEANFAFGSIKASKEDEEIAKNKAEAVLKAVNKENFEEYGKSLSKDEGYLFEDLGTFSKGMMVKEFEEAVSASEPNSIVKNIVKTEFGYHIIFVKESTGKDEGWTASHILVRVIPSEKTIAEKMEKINKIKDDINNGIVSFSEVPKLDEDIVQSILIKGITPDGLIPNLGYNPEIAKEIFETPLNEVKVKESANGIILFQKVKEIKPEAADFEKAKDTVKNDYINYKAAEYMKKLVF
ncbi:MAG: SurA N-terminal domain-containing protein [Fusobacterium gastrosuis]|uniref:SurA N-terminal domain-containing protein n=1 Tax=Fusobacterium gastrosuis TaxID=1755100 RepID=UPI00297288CC|nr:SurA N-terminal domain-containing protein [Fusobacteriaceae bacterium]MDD7410867.1 SurA N-terminal domain-containing protein [Fusobacteriaceae bacterium]MDY4011067.1 SurA N-terminal domain-containing protein [Fusobacterium gastrosuis]MDY5713220.1 SurA N-terminal domain-containing protein [Fusobacterium gastrosuis]MDY5794987.1 SurA N-terminal domain-containing protein [Fusobacterium gastrosuis]